MKRIILNLISVVIFLHTACMTGCGIPDQLIRPEAIRPTQFTTTKNGHVILLLGSSSVGKSYTCQCVRNFLGKIRDLPQIVTVAQDSEDDCGLPTLIRKSFPESWRDEHILVYATIIDHAQQGEIVLGDLILFESDNYDITESFIEKLRKITNVCPILIYCNLNRLLTHVGLRNSPGDTLDRRSPAPVVEQYLDTYASPTLTCQDKIDEMKPDELDQAIQALSPLIGDAFEQKSRDKCVKRLQDLHARTPSPIVCNKKLYNYIIKNDGDEEALEERIGSICYKLLKTLFAEGFNQNPK